LLKAMDESTRLGASVGGGIIKRAQAFVNNLTKSVKAIVKVLWNEVAVTHEPINEDTLGKVSFLPFEAFAKSFIFDDAERAVEFQKALSAGYGTESSRFSGGRALMPESLMGTGRKKLKDAFKITIDNIRKGAITDFSSLVSVLSERNMKSYSFIIAKTIALNKSRLY